MTSSEFNTQSSKSRSASDRQPAPSAAMAALMFEMATTSCCTGGICFSERLFGLLIRLQVRLFSSDHCGVIRVPVGVFYVVRYSFVVCLSLVFLIVLLCGLPLNTLGKKEQGCFAGVPTVIAVEVDGKPPCVFGGRDILRSTAKLQNQ